VFSRVTVCVLSSHIVAFGEAEWAGLSVSMLTCKTKLNGLDVGRSRGIPTCISG
jgi:hypothetical protein